MKSIQFLGAVGMVTGSCYLLSGDKGEKILVDLGMFQEGEDLGKLNYEDLHFDVSNISAVVVTHAHLDHCGRLPLLVKAGYKGKIYMTGATRMLVALVLADAAKVAEENLERRNKISPNPSLEKRGTFNNGGGGEQGVLYTEEDVERVLPLIEEVEYDKEFSVGSMSLVFRDAGHILGSASIEIGDTGKRIVFSGDLGNTPEDMIRPTEKIATADYVVMESTYGDRLHREEDPSEVLTEEIAEIEKTRGVLLIPSFSIERAQELLHRINHLKNEGKIGVGTKVFLDSPMAIKATEIFRRNPQFYNSQLARESKSDDPFDFPGLTLCESVEESKSILLNPGPKVIISGSGMMHGGRVLHHAINYLSDAKTRLLVVGYQAVGTLGRKLMDGSVPGGTGLKVTIYNQEVVVKANVREVEAMSCHADQKKLLKWLRDIKGVQKVFLTHGDEGAREALGEKIKGGLGIGEVILPKLGESLELLSS